MPVSEIVLKNCSLFQRATPAVVQQAASQMDILQLKKREVLLTGGRAFRGLGVVLQGRLQAMDYTIDGREVALTTVDSGEAFGQANLIAPRPVDLTWVAVSQSTLAVMPPQAAIELLRHAEMSMQVAVDLAQQVCEDCEAPYLQASPSINTASGGVETQGPLVTAAMGQQIEINAGALSGVRKGDEWLLANPARFPAELLSREGAPQTLLASVQSVTPYGSQLVVLAGPAQAVQANWRAWPTETLLKEPSVLPSARGAVPSKRPAKAPVSENANFTLSPY